MFLNKLFDGEFQVKDYDVIIVGGGASGVFAAYELCREDNNLKLLMIDGGNPIRKRKCPVTEGKVSSCSSCEICNIMRGFGGAGSLSDGKYNITNKFGGELYKYIGYDRALEYMQEVDDILCGFDGHKARLYSTANTSIKAQAIKNNLNLLDAKVRHFGTERNIKILEKISDILENKADILYRTDVENFETDKDGFRVFTKNGDAYKSRYLVMAAGRSGSKWMSAMCKNLGIKTSQNKVDIGVRVEMPFEVFSHITEEVYESKIIYQTRKYGDLVRTFCMNPHGEVVTENTNGVITVNGHSYADKSLFTENTNFALLVSNSFTQPFKNSNEYGESIAKLSNMLGGGVLLQRFGDLVSGRRSTEHSMSKCYTRPTLKATPGDLSLVIPKRQLDSIIEMIYQLDKIAPGTANTNTLLYGVEVKFYNSLVEVDSNLQTSIKNLFAVGDGSGVTHSLSQASASGLYVARVIKQREKDSV